MSPDESRVLKLVEQTAPKEPTEVIPKQMDENIDDVPITEFICHLTDREKARKHLEKMAKTVYDPEIREMVGNIPLYTKPNVRKNHLIARSGDTDVFWINLKTGRMLHL